VTFSGASVPFLSAATDTVSLSQEFDPQGSWVSFNVTKDLQDFTTGAAPNNGWVIQKNLQVQGEVGSIDFCSKENKLAEKCAPSLVVEYNPAQYVDEHTAKVKRDDSEAAHTMVSSKALKSIRRVNSTKDGSSSTGLSSHTHLAAKKSKTCNTTMQEEGVEGCVDLAMRLGLGASDKGKIINQDTKKPCLSQENEPTTMMMYPCPTPPISLNVDSMCTTTLKMQAVKDCVSLAEKLGLEAKDHKTLINAHNYKPCVDSLVQDHDEILYSCHGEDGAATTLSHAKTGTRAEGEAAKAEAESDKDATCETTMTEQGVSGCWDLAVQVGLDGKDHEKIKNTKNDQICAESNPQPDDVMGYPCSHQQKAVMDTLKKKTSSTTVSVSAAGKPTTASEDAKTAAIKALAAKAIASKAVTAKKMPTTSLHTLPTAARVLPTGTIHTLPTAARVLPTGAIHTLPTAARVLPTAAIHTLPKMAPMVAMPMTVTAAKPLNAATAKKVTFAKPAGAAGAVAAKPKVDLVNAPKCTTTMSAVGVTGCWDLAAAVGLDGDAHSFIVNQGNGMPCSDSNPQPNDVMSYPCPSGAKAPMAPVGGISAVGAKTLSSVPSSLAAGQCKTSMASAGVSGCWDLAASIGMDGGDHDKIVNSANGLPCSASNPQPNDQLTYPCALANSAKKADPAAAVAPVAAVAKPAAAVAPAAVAPAAVAPAAVAPVAAAAAPARAAPVAAAVAPAAGGGGGGAPAAVAPAAGGAPAVAAAPVFAAPAAVAPAAVAPAAVAPAAVAPAAVAPAAVAAPVMAAPVAVAKPAVAPVAVAKPAVAPVAVAKPVVTPVIAKAVAAPVLAKAIAAATGVKASPMVGKAPVVHITPAQLNLHAPPPGAPAPNTASIMAAAISRVTGEPVDTGANLLKGSTEAKSFHGFVPTADNTPADGPRNTDKPEGLNKTVIATALSRSSDSDKATIVKVDPITGQVDPIHKLVSTSNSRTPMCSTTMLEMGVSSCWDLAEAVGMKGSEHEMIINSDKDSVCADSNPQPTEMMSFPCGKRKEDTPVLAADPADASLNGTANATESTNATLTATAETAKLSEDLSEQIKKEWLAKYGPKKEESAPVNSTSVQLDAESVNSTKSELNMPKIIPAPLARSKGMPPVGLIRHAHHESEDEGDSVSDEATAHIDLHEGSIDEEELERVDEKDRVHHNENYTEDKHHPDKPVWFVYQANGDSVVKEGSDSSHGDDTVMVVKPKGKNRALVKFDDFDIGKEILSATLSMKVLKIGDKWPEPFGSSLSAYRMKHKWDEKTASGMCPSSGDCSDEVKANWKLFKQSFKDSPFEAEPSDSVPASDALTPKGTTLSFNVTEDVRKMIDGTMANYGWMVAKNLDHEKDDGEITFCTRENVNAAECAPKLIIEYGSNIKESASKLESAFFEQTASMHHSKVRHHKNVRRMHNKHHWKNRDF